jgi:Na+-translocating ferredoxin:NAD+ oxidoreductase RnfC subunit
MSSHETIVRVDATYDLRIRVGDHIRRGDRISHTPDAQRSAAPISGTVTEIHFDPANHEFIIMIAHAT